MLLTSAYGNPEGVSSGLKSRLELVRVKAACVAEKQAADRTASRENRSTCMTIVLTIPEGWTKEEWKAKLNYLLADEAQWDEEPVTEEEDGEAEGW